MARPAEEFTDEGRGACLVLRSGLRGLLKTRQGTPAPPANSGHSACNLCKQTSTLSYIRKIEHAALNDKRRLQDDLFGTPAAPTGKTLGHAAKSMLCKDTRILLNRGQRRLKENVGRRVVIAHHRDIAGMLFPISCKRLSRPRAMLSELANTAVASVASTASEAS